MQTYGGLLKLLSELIEERVSDPRDNVLSDLAQRVSAEEITVHEAAEMGWACSPPDTRPART